MEQRSLKLLKIASLIIILFGVEFMILTILNTPFKAYLTQEEVTEYKEDMIYFSNTHQNEDGLFLQPSIDTNYRAIDSINFSEQPFDSSDLFNPKDNENLKKGLEDFYLNYMVEKQDDLGGYGDISGLGNILSTYEVVEMLDKLDGSFLTQDNFHDRIDNIIDFLNLTLAKQGYGFRLNNYSQEADIISTFMSIKLAKRFSANWLLNDNSLNISRFINFTYLPGSYRLSLTTPLATPETTYYGINAYLEMGMTYDTALNISFNTYFTLLYNNFNGGYSPYAGNGSTVQSTYYSLASLDTLGRNLHNATKTLEFILSCARDDGGFAASTNDTLPSDFMSGWAALKAMQILEKNASAVAGYDLDTYKKNYYNWLHERQAINGLFGDKSLEANYWGVLSQDLSDSNSFEDEIDIDAIWEYTEECYVESNGGFSSLPDLNATIFSSYCAVNIYNILLKYQEIELPSKEETIRFFADQQNNDGGFKIGNDTRYLYSLFGPYQNIVEGLINTNISTMESTYWCLQSLGILNGLEEVKEETLIHWMRAAQNADGGFSVILGTHSDVISTYYGLETFKLISQEPISKVSAVEFIKLAQSDDGSFGLVPMISDYYEIPSNFLVTYLGAKGLYDYQYQPEYIEELIEWYKNSFSSSTGGMGDQPNFGADLRNTPYAIQLLEEIQYDQAFDPTPWTNLIFTIMLIQVAMIVGYVVLKGIIILNASISEKIKEQLGIGDKLNVSYLQRYSAIRCENLSIFAGGKLIVDSVSMQIEHGEILGVLGESGAGKSTFVKALLGMRKYTGVSEIYGMDSKKNSKKFRPIYGYVPQDLGKIYLNFTTMQNLVYFGKQYGLTEREIISKGRRILRSLEIEDKANEYVKNLSGGQKRRVSIAIALIHTPIFCILDEPTSGLDPVVRENLWIALTKINEQFNTTLIVITHYPEESRFCHKVAIFGRNRGMIDFGPPRLLLEQMPGKGRSIEVSFNKIQENAVERLEEINNIEKALENKAGVKFSVYSNLTLNEIINKIEGKFGSGSIKEVTQTDAQMEQYFRYKSMVIPNE